MANKISICLDRIETALAALVTAGTLKAVKRSVIVPEASPRVPALGLAPSRLRREGETWICDVTAMLVTSKGTEEFDETIIDLIAAVDACLTTLIEAGTAGASVDRPKWDTWIQRTPQETQYSYVGAMGELRIRVVDPLTIVE